MNIEQMTHVSYLLFGISVCFAIAAAAMFFVFDIPHCIKMVSIKHKRKPVDIKNIKLPKTQKAAQSTEPIISSVSQTLLLNRVCEDTVKLDTEKLEIIQDISLYREKGGTN